MSLSAESAAKRCRSDITFRNDRAHESATHVMTPTWLIESGVYGKEIEPLVAEIRRQGMTVESISHRILAQRNRLNAGGQPLPTTPA
jgi:hypothetical protein